jgi:hypothetical protein
LFFFLGVCGMVCGMDDQDRKGDYAPGEGGSALAGLTPMQSRFAYLVGRDGLSLTKAAEGAGFANAGNYGSALMRNPHVRQAVHAIRAAAIEGDLSSLALSTMRKLMADDLTPAPVRFQAAKWTLETAGHKAAEALGAPAPEKGLSDMSLEELEAFIARGESALDRLKVVGAPVVEVQAVPVSGSAQVSAQVPALA